MEKESLNDYNPKDGLKEVYHGALHCQSSIYASCTIPEQKGVRPARILLSPLLKNFNVYSCANAPKVDVLEKMFAYMPQGCQIISIDVFQAEETPLEIITGSNILSTLDYRIVVGLRLFIISTFSQGYPLIR